MCQILVCLTLSGVEGLVGDRDQCKKFFYRHENEIVWGKVMLWLCWEGYLACFS